MTLNKAQAAAIQEAAQRLSYLVGSCPEGHRPLDPSCPFCRDEGAYEALLAAFPKVVSRPVAYQGKPVSLSDLKRGRNAL